MIRFLFAVWLVYMPSQAFAYVPDNMGGFFRVGDLLFRIPKTQQIDGRIPSKEEPDPQKPEPIETGEPDVVTSFTIYGSSALQFSKGYEAKRQEDGSFRSMEGPTVQIIVQSNNVKLPSDAWCIKQKELLDQNGSRLPEIMNDTKSNYLSVNDTDSYTYIVPDHKATIFGVPAILHVDRQGTTGLPKNNFYFGSFSLTSSVSITIRFHERDVKGTTVDAVMGNIEKAVRSWVVSTPFSNRRFIAEQSNYCKP